VEGSLSLFLLLGFPLCLFFFCSPPPSSGSFFFFLLSFVFSVFFFLPLFFSFLLILLFFFFFLFFFLFFFFYQLVQSSMALGWNFSLKVNSSLFPFLPSINFLRLPDSENEEGWWDKKLPPFFPPSFSLKLCARWRNELFFSGAGTQEELRNVPPFLPPFDTKSRLLASTRKDTDKKEVTIHPFSFFFPLPCVNHPREFPPEVCREVDVGFPFFFFSFFHGSNKNRGGI